MNARDTSIELVIPHLSRWDLLSRLLDSVETQTRVPAVCVVDNGSTDESLEQLALRPDVRVVSLPQNAGFGRAVNAGAMSSSAEFVILVNNDMVLESEFVSAVAAALEDEDCAVSTLQLAADSTIDTIGVGCDQSLDGFDVGHGASPAEVGRLTAQILGPSGGAAGFRRETFTSLGGYDEAIFAYLEDLDLAIRLHEAGVRTRFVPGAVAHHLHSATLGPGSAKKNELLGWSRGYVSWKYRASVSPADRVRGAFVDFVVYCGKAVIDRNLGAFRGRIRFRRERADHAQAARSAIPMTRETLRGTFSRRLGRRKQPA